ncbi:hypothetical protein AX16_002640 [Volvariella volvacea WC 439]|nr:hypothetical protein AX16_002640 [Volvariella volvacea WC 439]
MSSQLKQDVLQVPSTPAPSEPLRQSYTYHSPIPTAGGPYILGVDEAGRGPVLGPLVYGVAYCPKAYQATLEELGFADSKTLTAETRSELLKTLQSDPANLGWSLTSSATGATRTRRLFSPQAISGGMLKRPPINLNRQSEEATILLIRDVLAKGIELSEVYVDALGPTTTYQAFLSKTFPGIDFTVTNKADSKFKIVGAASVAAKVTRDACIEGWIFEEHHSQTEDAQAATNGSPWSRSEVGSGYPSDPKTQAWLKTSLEPTFGFPKLVRFSWTTVKVMLEKDAHDVKWIDEGQASLIKAFETGKGADKDRSTIAKDLKLFSVVDL